MPAVAPGAGDAKTVWTIGHSTRTLDQLMALLAHWRITAVADVRRFPGSRRYPYFSSDALARSLPEHGIAYRWIVQLGGRRKVQPDSPNTSWRNASFKGCSDQPCAGAMMSRRPAGCVARRREDWPSGQAVRRDLRAFWASPNPLKLSMMGRGCLPTCLPRSSRP